MATTFKSILVTIGVFLSFLAKTSQTVHYEPTWDSLDSRPLPDWYDDAKLGIFIHWGVFSVPSFSSEWFWYDWKARGLPGIVDFMQKNYPPDFTYPDFAPEFRAEFYSPVEWAGLFKESGAKYVVLTSKHHEGFTNWPSNYSFNWNAKDVGPDRDLVGDLADAVRDYSLKFGLYHSMFEWFNPLYKKDEASGFKSQNFVKAKTMPELYEIVRRYKPEVVWSDGDGDAPAEYWTSQEFLAWLYNDSPVKDTVVVNDRWGKNVSCHHGGFFTCSDRYNPGKLQAHKWENAMTIDRYSWGYRRNAPLSNYLSIEDLLKTFITTVSCGGNMLMNVGPTSYGRIVPIMEERLKQMGEWLTVNGDAIYGTRPWSHQNDTLTKDVWYTKKKSPSGYTVYAILLQWPKAGTLTLGAPLTTSATNVSLLGYQGKFYWKKGLTGGIEIDIPKIAWNLMPCKWAWVFKLDGISN